MPVNGVRDAVGEDWLGEPEGGLGVKEVSALEDEGPDIVGDTLTGARDPLPAGVVALEDGEVLAAESDAFCVLVADAVDELVAVAPSDGDRDGAAEVDADSTGDGEPDPVPPELDDAPGVDVGLSDAAALLECSPELAAVEKAVVVVVGQVEVSACSNGAHSEDTTAGISSACAVAGTASTPRPDSPMTPRARAPRAASVTGGLQSTDARGLLNRVRRCRPAPRGRRRGVRRGLRMPDLIRFVQSGGMARRSRGAGATLPHDALRAARNDHGAEPGIGAGPSTWRQRWWAVAPPPPARALCAVLGRGAVRGARRVVGSAKAARRPAPGRRPRRGPLRPPRRERPPPPRRGLRRRLLGGGLRVAAIVLGGAHVDAPGWSLRSLVFGGPRGLTVLVVAVTGGHDPGRRTARPAPRTRRRGGHRRRCGRRSPQARSPAARSLAGLVVGLIRTLLSAVGAAGPGLALIRSRGRRALLGREVSWGRGGAAVRELRPFLGRVRGWGRRRRSWRPLRSPGAATTCTPTRPSTPEARSSPVRTAGAATSGATELSGGAARRAR